MKRNGRGLVLAAVLSFILVPFLAPVLGDGMAVYPSYIKDKDELEELYGSTYESRQLANVVVLDDDQQRIDLFLSLFSLKPGNNMTLLVPFRELPTDVTVKQMKDRDFLDSIGYSRIKDEADKQDLSKNMGRLTGRTGDWFERDLVSASFTPIAGIGLYIEDNYELSYSGDGKGLDLGGMALSGEGDDDSVKKKEVEKIDTYEFDGVSISVYSVSENATMEDFTEGIELEGLPEMTKETLEEYKGHYAVTIDSITAPPIDPEEFTMMNELMPRTMDDWELFVKQTPKLEDEYVLYDKVQELAFNGFKEILGSGEDLILLSARYGKYWNQHWEPEEWLEEYRWHLYDQGYGNPIEPQGTPFDIMKDLSDITHTVYGFTPFNGTVISVTTSRDNGNIYFPLGTSDSWSNPIARTVVVVKMDRKFSFGPNIDPTAEAFMDGDRYYLFDFPNDNPKDDLHGPIGSTKTTELFSASASKAVNRTYPWASIILALILYLLFWFVILKASYLLMGATRDGKVCRALTGRNLLFALLAVLITAPGVHLLFRKDVQGIDKGSEDRRFNRSHAVHSIVMISLGALLLLLAVI